jgi:hypothetical protein
MAGEADWPRETSAFDPQQTCAYRNILRGNELNIALPATPVHIEIGSQVASYPFGNLFSCDYSVRSLWAGLLNWPSTLVKLFVQIVSRAQWHLPVR